MGGGPRRAKSRIPEVELRRRLGRGEARRSPYGEPSMAERQVDPARLKGEALRHWYLRSPEDVEQERQAAAAQRSADFFGSLRPTDPESGFNGDGMAGKNVDPGFSREPRMAARRVEPEFSWTAVGANRWRGDRAPAWDLAQRKALARSAPRPSVAGPGFHAAPVSRRRLVVTQARGSGACMRPRLTISPSSAANRQSSPARRVRSAGKTAGWRSQP